MASLFKIRPNSEVTMKDQFSLQGSTCVEFNPQSY